MNVSVLTGRLTKDPTLKYLPNSGKAVSEFDIAVENNYSKDKSSNVDYFKIQCWNTLAETTANNLSKGRKVSIVGFLKNNHWTDENNKLHKDNIVVATRIEYLDFPKNNVEEFEYVPPNMIEVDEDTPF